MAIQSTKSIITTIHSITPIQLTTESYMKSITSLTQKITQLSYIMDISTNTKNLKTTMLKSTMLIMKSLTTTIHRSLMRRLSLSTISLLNPSPPTKITQSTNTMRPVMMTTVWRGNTRCMNTMKPVTKTTPGITMTNNVNKVTTLPQLIHTTMQRRMLMA